MSLVALIGASARAPAPSRARRFAPRVVVPTGIPAGSSWSRRRRPPPRVSPRVSAGDDDDDLFSFLEAQMAEEEGTSSSGGVVVDADGAPEPGSPMTGEELRGLVVAKWGKMYDTRIHQRRDQFNKLGLYLQVMWKFVGQKSFPMTEAQYVEQLDAVAELLTEWGAQDTVRAGIPACTKFPKMDTTGANAVMIPLDIDVEDDS